MKTKHLASMLREDYTTIKVVFDDEVRRREGAMGIKSYTYKVLKADAAQLKVNSLVVTPPSADGRRGNGVACVVEVHAEPLLDLDSDIDYRWIIGPLDTTRYDAIVAHDEEMQKTLVEVEKQLKRKSVIDQYKEAVAGNPKLNATLQDLLKGPKLLGTAGTEAVAPKSRAKNSK